MVPPKFRPPSTGRSSPESGSVNPELSAFYHGATLTGAMRVLSEGWKTGLGAGGDMLKALCGLAAPGFYVGRTFSVALTYPGTPTTPWAPGRSSVNGGTVPSLQHSCPLRIMFRAVADTHDALWRRKDGFNTQYLFRPEHLYIMHVYFVGIGYGLVAVEHPITDVKNLQHDEANDAKAGCLMRHASLVPTVG